MNFLESSPTLVILRDLKFYGWYGTAVQTSAPKATLIYNCALMPAICENVQQWINNDPISRSLPRDFHMDLNSRHTSKRREKSCPGTWRLTHPCPELFPEVVRGWNTTSRTFTSPGNSLLPAIPGNPFTAAFTNEIAAANGVDSSGLAYTCDEFPPASWIEGGSNGFGNTANTRCAPQGLGCKSNVWAAVKNAYHGIQGRKYPLARSEQDWQSTAHSHLSRYMRKKFDIMAFEFTTVSVNPGATPNAATIRVPGKTVTVSKRDIEVVETPFIPIPKPYDGVQIIVVDATETVAFAAGPVKTPEPVIVNEAIAVPDNHTLYY
ncbi:hypothetical protein B0J11DRAFT_541761 [Dendryphion nanum]|uniref:Uncharacterized protein n=1 Tax=Dendryphion nanum TaxID=256645 RepID=A0A9P9D5Q0_9PLEO|nr:hypothetical protein B0J11DRAFT_541761 [Dendryphion nanum]